MAEDTPATYRIMDLAEVERPRERLANLGAQALSAAELLAILLRVGIHGENAVQLGHRLLQEVGGLSGLHRASLTELCQVKGLGFAKAAQLKAAIELGKRIHTTQPEDRPEIHEPNDVAGLVQYEMSALTQEQLWVLVLDTRNRVLHIEKMYKGSLNSSQVRVGELFKPAIARNAASIILVHNHPSGDPSPSPEDLALTRAVFQAGKLLDIGLLDHLVVGWGRYVSIKEKNAGIW